MQSSRPIPKGQIADFISTSTQNALNLKANILNPSFSGTVKFLGNVPNGILTINGVNSIISLSGTTNLLTKWNASGTLSNSSITDTGAAITLGLATTVSGNLTATSLIKNGGLNTQILMADGSISTLAGVTNTIPKFTAVNTFGNSRITDDGTYLGIGTFTAATKDITLGNQTVREIGVEQSESIFDGKNLTITAGRTVNFLFTTQLIQLTASIGQQSSVFSGLNGDIFLQDTGNTFRKQIAGIGGLTSYTTTGISFAGGGILKGGCVTPSGDLYVCLNNGDIYKQSGSTGSFVSQSAGTKTWSSMCCTPNGDVYASVGKDPAFGGSTGDIYRQSGGTGSFVAMGFTNRYYFLASAPNGDIYVAVNNGSIYRIDNGTSVLVDLVQANLNWSGIAVAPNGDIYASVYSGDVYKKSGAGNFIAQSQVSRTYTGIAVNTKSTLYLVTANNGNFYLNISVLGVDNLQGGILKLKAGTGKGTGQSRVQIITGQITTSGTNMQTEQIVAQFDESGNTTFNGLIIKSGGTSNQYLMADGSVSVGSALISGNIITGITYTLDNSDHSKQLQTTNASTVTIIIPTGLTSGFACDVIQEGLGQVSINGMSGTTVRYSTFELPTTFEQYSMISIISITNLPENYKLAGQLTSI